MKIILTEKMMKAALFIMIITSSHIGCCSVYGECSGNLFADMTWIYRYI